MVEITRQLLAVSNLQKHLLPRELPRMEGWEIATHYQVGPWPGGDYYDFLPLPDGRLLFLVGDGSDEGAPSSVLVALVRATMHSCPLSSGQERLPFCPMQGAVIRPPHIVLGNLNRVLTENSLEEQHMTMFCGVLDPRGGQLHYANAGHLPPCLWRASERRVDVLRDASGLPLGLGHSSTYAQRRTELEPGDVLVAYSDGLTAALNRVDITFGRERLIAAMAASADRGARAVKDHLVEAFTEFMGGRKQQDDVTIVVFARTF